MSAWLLKSSEPPNAMFGVLLGYSSCVGQQQRRQGRVTRQALPRLRPTPHLQHGAPYWWVVCNMC
jgi:hypothetical protein